MSTCNWCDDIHQATSVVSAFFAEPDRDVYDMPCCTGSLRDCRQFMWSLPGVTHVQDEDLEQEAS